MDAGGDDEVATDAAGEDEAAEDAAWVLLSIEEDDEAVEAELAQISEALSQARKKRKT